jgi:hypothetical protein
MKMDSTVPLSKMERHKQGKTLREKCPRSSQATWEPRSKSLDPIKLLEESDADRVPGLIPLKYQRMAESPFQFFRGAAIIQARDLGNGSVSGIIVQACGDCHLMNFGGFASPERDLLFDINDFDETFPGPWEWDIKRLGASLMLAVRDRSFSTQIAKDAVRATAASYRERMFGFADMNMLDTWYARVSFDALKEYSWKDPDINHIEQYRNSLQTDRLKLIDRYPVGSVGTRCYLYLLLAEADDSLFLQSKEARRSVLESPRGKSRFAHLGFGVVTGQRLMRAANDIFLRWFRSAHGHDYYVRQFRDMKVSAEVETFRPSTLVGCAIMCGWALARAHAKPGDAAMIAGYLGSKDQFDEALVKYAAAYADQAERDFATFQAANRSGRLQMETAKGVGLEFAL